MYIEQIELTDFRNYPALKLNFHPKVNLFLGNNAQGKTNLLESIYVTSLGKSFRTNRDRELIRFDQEFCRIKLKAQKDGEETTVEMAVNREGKKGFKVDGIKIKKSSELLENIYIVIFSPEDLKIVKEEPEKRRRFIDRELCQIKPSYYNSLNQYKKVLAQRNAYLKEFTIDPGVLDIWDTKLAEYGGKIIIQRAAFIDKINLLSREIHRQITNEKEELQVIYEPNIDLYQTESEQIHFFYKKLEESREEDLRLRTTRKGPHKDDLKLLANNIDIRSFGSQGQQRTAALSLKLSELKLIKGETGVDPILLLDDVLSELDRERQNFLIHSFGEIQIFITTTELSSEVKAFLPDSKTFFIEAGKIVNETENPIF